MSDKHNEASMDKLSTITDIFQDPSKPFHWVFPSINPKNQFLLPDMLSWPPGHSFSWFSPISLPTPSQSFFADFL